MQREALRKLSEATKDYERLWMAHDLISKRHADLASTRAGLASAIISNGFAEGTDFHAAGAYARGFVHAALEETLAPMFEASKRIVKEAIAKAEIEIERLALAATTKQEEKAKVRPEEVTKAWQAMQKANQEGTKPKKAS